MLFPDKYFPDFIRKFGSPEHGSHRVAPEMEDTVGPLPGASVDSAASLLRAASGTCAKPSPGLCASGGLWRAHGFRLIHART